METLSYLAQANLYWIALYACYALFLRRQTFLHWNRAYLLGSLLAAFALPLVQYPEAAPPVPVVYEMSAAALTVGAAVVVPSSSLLTWENLLCLVYSVGVLLMLVRLARQFGSLFSFIKKGESIDMGNHIIVLLDEEGGATAPASFSFLRWIFISRSDYEQNFDTILCHELVHVRQRHSLDILLTEGLWVVFWFNPVLILYKNALQQIHEYLADQQAKADNRDGYADFLLSYATNAPSTVLTNQFFNPKLLKNRIAMLYKNKNSNWSLGKYAAVALLISFTSLLVASCERDSLPTAKNSSSKNMSGMVEVSGVVTDANGKAIPGADIMVMGATRGTTTSSEGRFRLDAPAGSELKFSYEGFKNHLLKLNPKYEKVAYRVAMTPGEGQTSQTNGAFFMTSPDGKTFRAISQASTYNGETIFTVVEEQPQFPGGIDAMHKFLGDNVKYPEAARRAKVQGRVFLNFVVTKEGEIKNVTILKGIGFGIDEEALRVMDKMPRWIPGKQDGKPLNVRYNLPIAFELGKKPELKKSEADKRVGMQGVAPDSEIERVTGAQPTRLEDSEQMLLVVDGKIVSDRSEKPELDPAAVESINIMKDAAAIKKYGDKGKNGAIEIILKKGKS
ncbi:TonB family protein [Persicitalea sp.]|uniref:TonB family protein n=1 Tax=Persicitalea sp. TaxID=3100273 RepID=UPI0035942B34